MSAPTLEMDEPIIIPATQQKVIDRWLVPSISIAQDPATLMRRATIVVCRGGDGFVSELPEHRVEMVIPDLETHFAEGPPASYLAGATQALGALVLIEMLNRGLDVKMPG
ncbi:MAG: hypothetical protein ACRDD1_18155 [Planctomycetia bacterium]